MTSLIPESPPELENEFGSFLSILAADGLPETVLVLRPLSPDDGATPRYFNLSDNNDRVTLPPGLAATHPGGVRTLRGDDLVQGTDDPDIVYGNIGGDYLEGNGGADRLFGGRGRDYLSGGAGNDELFGNLQSDYLVGGGGNDAIYGGQGPDILTGEAGDDTLSGDLGRDAVWGGRGADTFILRPGDAPPNTPIGTDRPQTGDAIAIDELVVDLILDYNAAEGDRIQLGGGVLPSDLILTQRYLVIGDSRDYNPGGPFPPALIRTADFRTEAIAATLITQASTGLALGLVRGVAPAQVQIVGV